MYVRGTIRRCVKRGKDSNFKKIVEEVSPCRGRDEYEYYMLIPLNTIEKYHECK